MNTKIYEFGLVPNSHRVLEMAIEEGVAYGYMRAHKHVDHPTEAQFKDEITKAVMDSIYEWFDNVEDKADV